MNNYIIEIPYADINTLTEIIQKIEFSATPENAQEIFQLIFELTDNCTILDVTNNKQMKDEFLTF